MTLAGMACAQIKSEKNNDYWRNQNCKWREVVNPHWNPNERRFVPVVLFSKNQIAKASGSCSRSRLHYYDSSRWSWNFVWSTSDCCSIFFNNCCDVSSIGPSIDKNVGIYSSVNGDQNKGTIFKSIWLGSDLIWTTFIKRWGPIWKSKWCTIDRLRICICC